MDDRSFRLGDHGRYPALTNMRNLTLMILSLACLGCVANDSTPVVDDSVEYFAMGGDRQLLTPEFSSELSRLASGPSSKFRGHGGLAVAPRGSFEISGKNYQFYGRFMVSGGRRWESNILKQFWDHLNQNGESSSTTFTPK